jgi:hypothetical protein
VNTWLAIVVFCIQGECAFMVSNKEVLPTTKACEVKANEYMAILESHGADMAIPTCIQLKYKVT